MDDFQDVGKACSFPEAKVQKLIADHPEICVPIEARPSLRSHLFTALNMAAYWFGALVPPRRAKVRENSRIRPCLSEKAKCWRGT